MDSVDEYLNQLELQEGPDAISLTGDPIIIVRIQRREGAEVNRLLDKGANPNALAKNQDTLLQLAIEYGMEDVSRRLLSFGVDPNEIHATHTPTPLFRAARSGNKRLVRLLLEHGALVDVPSYANETALMSACESGHLEVVLELINAGAGINRTCKSGCTPLIHAGMGGHLSIAKILLGNGANPGDRDCNGYNATDWARKKHDGMVAQGFRELGIADHYNLDSRSRIELVSTQMYDVFVSYKHIHYLNDSDEILRIFSEQEKKVFVDRYELKLDGDTLIDDETVKWKLKQALLNTSLTIFFEIFWDGSHGEPRYSDDRLDWQYFELLNSRRAVLVSPERKVCQQLVMVPGEKLRMNEGFAYKNYSGLCERLLRTYF